MKYCDFDGGNHQAKYVRFRIVSANTSKWLRLFEIEVNKHSGTMPVAVDNNGNGITEINDRKAYTCAPNEGSNLYYRFLQIHPLRNVTIYQDGGIDADAAAYITLDGKSWTRIGELKGYVCKLDLTDYPEATQLRFYWKSKAPAIYEIFEETDETAELITTRIVSPKVSAQNFDCNNANSMEVYSTDGQCLYKGKCVPANRWNASPNKVVIAKYHMPNGETLTRRLIAR